MESDIIYSPEQLN